MKNASDGEKLLSASRKAARLLSGQLRTMAYRMRATRNQIAANRRYCGRDLQTDVAEFVSYIKEVERLCTDQADRVDTHDRLVISQLHHLAQMVRENDY